MTFVSYPDIRAQSPGTKYRIEITGNGQEDFFRSQSEFTYRLVESDSGNEVWRWRASDEHGRADCPREAWVNDEGYVVVRWHHRLGAGIIVISPSGEIRLDKAVRWDGDDEPALLDGESRIHIGSSSTGPNWEDSSISLFHVYGGRSYWSILTWWGRRLVIDLRAGKAIDELPTVQESLVVSLEQSWIIDQLVQAQDALLSPREGVDWWWRVVVPAYSAAYHAGALRIERTVPLLHALESSPLVGETGHGFGLNIEHLLIRSIAKISLLRLGVAPQWFANFNLVDDKSRARCSYSECLADRPSKLIEAEMPLRLLLAQLGVPEFIECDYWDYCFFEHGRCYTIRVHWNDRHLDSAIQTSDAEAPGVDPFRVAQVERIDAPPWTIDELRAYCIAHRCT